MSEETGAVAEWSKATDLGSVERDERSVGSIPTRSGSSLNVTGKY